MMKICQLTYFGTILDIHSFSWSSETITLLLYVKVRGLHSLHGKSRFYSIVNAYFCMLKENKFMRKPLFRGIYILFFLLFSFMAFSQEVCDNGIDDDGDGFIDLLDDDCDCTQEISARISLFKNASFESYDNTDCKPTKLCALESVDDWNNASDADPNLWINCGTTNNLQDNILPAPPCPMPDGNKCIGLFNGYINTTGTDEIWKEYIGTSMTQRLTAGLDYEMSFFVGFLDGTINDKTSKPVDWVIYGHTTDSVFTGSSCPLDAPSTTPWEELAQLTISHNAYGWKRYSISFTALKDYKSIIIGPSCLRDPNADDYYYLDHLYLSEDREHDFVIENSGLACNGDLVLTADIDKSLDLDYQWYQDGIAIPNAYSDTLVVEPGTNSIFQLRLSNSYGCVTSTAFEVESIPVDINFIAPNGLCEDTDMVRIELDENYEMYDWSTQVNTPNITTSRAGIYAVTVVDNRGCIGIDSVELVPYTDVQYHLEATNETTLGGNDGTLRVVMDESVSNVDINWFDNTDPVLHDGLSSGQTYCVTVTADERCPIDLCEQIDLDIQPLVVTELIKDVDCFGFQDGSININIIGGLEPYEITWTHDSNLDGQTNISNLRASTYSVIVKDNSDQEIKKTFEVRTPAILEFELTGDNPSCHNTIDGQLNVLNVQGGTSPYSITWNHTIPNGDYYASNLEPSTYIAQIKDDHNCITTQKITLNQPKPLSALFELEHPFCFGQEEGKITANNIKGGVAPYQLFLKDETGTPNIVSVNNLAGEKYHDVILQDANGCQIDKSFFLAYKKEGKIDLGEDQLVRRDEVARIRAYSDLSTDGYEWYWLQSGNSEICSDCHTIEFVVEDDETIVLEAISTEGCIMRDTVNIEALSSHKLYFPNAFSPNGDQHNDRFEIYNTKDVTQVNHIKIFHPSGSKAFEARNIDPEHIWGNWNNNSVSQEWLPGVYYYIIDVQFQDGSKKNYRGELLLHK